MTEEHIIADKTLIRIAKVISVLFTPFSIPFLAFLILFIFSYLRIMPLQYKLIVLGVVYCFTILMPMLTISSSGKSTVSLPRIWLIAKTLCSVHPDHYFLHILPANDVSAQHSLVYERYHSGSTDYDDHLCSSQLALETERTHGRFRSYCRRAGRFQCFVRLQSCMVVVPVHSDIRGIGNGTPYFKSPYTGRGCRRVCRRPAMLTAGATPFEQYNVPHLDALTTVGQE